MRGLISIVVCRIIHTRMNLCGIVKHFQIFKTTEVSYELKTNFIETTISVFGDNKFGLTFGWRTLLIIPLINFVVFWAVNKRNDIRLRLRPLDWQQGALKPCHKASL